MVLDPIESPFFVWFKSLPNPQGPPLNATPKRQDLPGRGSDVLALGRRGEGLQQLLAAQVLSQNVAALGAARNAQVQMDTK